MNLNEYDNVKEQINKNKTWIDVKHKLLFSRELIFNNYISILKRYNVRTNTYDYYVALSKEPPINKNYDITTVDKYGRILINLSSIWYESSLVHINKNQNINIYHIESNEEGNIYQLDI